MASHENGDWYGDWYEAAREAAVRLTRVRSVSRSAGETEAAREVARLLRDSGLADAYTECGLDPLPGDPYGRHNAYAFLRGASPRAVVLMGHIDTVDTADYGPLEPWATDPDALAARHETLRALFPEAAADLAASPDDWMFGRGVADMKSGVAATIVVLRRLAARARASGARPPLSVVLLATVDEETESAGVLRAVRFLDELRARHGLEYVGAINTDYTTDQYPGDPHRYIYTGTVGKLLPSLFVVGRPAHAGDPFAGLDANLLAAELISDLSMNPDLCDAAHGHVTPPPVTLRAADLKTRYDTQLPFAAYLYLNVLTVTTTPGALLETLRARAEAALARALAHIDAAEERWRRVATAALAGETRGEEARMRAADVALAGEGQPRSGAALTYAALRDEVVERLGEGRVGADLADEWDRWPADLDKRERTLHLTRCLWALSGREGPAVVIAYAPPYYPHVAPEPSALHTAVAAVAAGRPELNLALRPYFPLLCDLSYLRLDPGVDLAPLTANMPVWHDGDGDADGGTAPQPGSYTLPLDAIRALALPVVNLGPYGRGVHQPGERVLMSYAFGALPALIDETIERLADLVASDSG